MVAVLDWLGDLPQTEFSRALVAERCKLDWRTVNRIWPKLIKFKLIEPSQKIGAAKLYRTMPKAPVFRALWSLDFEVSNIMHEEYFKKQKPSQNHLNK